MLSKVIAYGPDRATALRRLRAALAETVTLGVPTNAGFLRRLLAHPAVVAGELDTGLVEREADGLVPDGGAGGGVRGGGGRTAATALRPRRRAAGPTRSPCRAAGGWAAHRPAGPPSDLRVSRGSNPSPHAACRRHPQPVTGDRVVRRPWTAIRHTFHRAGDWLGRDGDAWHVRDHDPVGRRLTGAAHAGADTLTAPMPGTVTVVKVAVGDEVAAGQSLLVVEAMKMEHVISAPHAGTVTELDVTPGTTVAMDQVLAVVAPRTAEEDAG